MKILVKGVSFSYQSTRALEDVSMSVVNGQMVSILGPNGSGKSTLIKCIDRILRPKLGTVLIDGRDTANIKPRELAKLLGYIPQSGADTFPFTVFDVVLMGRHPYLGWSPSPEDLNIVSDMLDLLGLIEFALGPITELSGGERQRVLLARALAQQPQALLLDEPTANLDIRHQLRVLELLERLVRQKGISALMAIHDVNLAARFSDKIVLLKQGQILAAGEPRAIITRENIRAIYGVDILIDTRCGWPYIVPLEPA